MNKVLATGVAAAVLVLGLAVLDSPAHKSPHRHEIAVKAFAKQVTLPRRSDPDTAGVIGVIVVCPKNHRAVGGGHDSNRIAYVPVSKLGFNRYSVIAVNQIDRAGMLEAEVGCVPNKTRPQPLTAARSKARLKSDVESFRKQRRGS